MKSQIVDLYALTSGRGSEERMTTSTFDCATTERKHRRVPPQEQIDERELSSSATMLVHLIEPVAVRECELRVWVLELQLGESVNSLLLHVQIHEHERGGRDEGLHPHAADVDGAVDDQLEREESEGNGEAEEGHHEQGAVVQVLRQEQAQSAGDGAPGGEQTGSQGRHCDSRTTDRQARTDEQHR